MSSDAIDDRIIADYLPVEFSPRWVRERQLGWRLVRDETNLRVVASPHRLFSRFLILAKGQSAERLAEAVKRCRRTSPLSPISLHDFSAVPESPAPRIGRTTFRVATNAERCTNVNTFVVDLRVERDALWQRVRQNAKGACKKAESIGTRVALTRTPKRDEVDAFFRAYEVLAERKGLRVPDRRLIERMLADGALLFVHCRDADGRTLCMNLVYLAGETAFYLHGVGTERSKGEGQYVQWETIKHLQANGTMRWYDLGGVPSTDPKDGIFFFKRSMGGTLVPLGVEYIHVPALVARGLRYRARAQTAVKRLFFGSS